MSGGVERVEAPLGKSAAAPEVIFFVGDSITHDGKYIEYVETVLIADTGKRYDILGLGLSSETVSGLSSVMT